MTAGPASDNLALLAETAFGRLGGVRGSVRGFVFGGDVAVVAAMDLNLADAPKRPISLADGRKAKSLVTPAALGDDFGPGLWERLLSPLLAGRSLSLLRATS